MIEKNGDISKINDSNGNNNLKKDNIRRNKTFFQLIKIYPQRYLFSHHPDCKKYKFHTFKLWGRKLCIGCFIGYPSAIIAIILATYLLNKPDLNSSLIFYMGIAFLLTIVFNFTKLTKNKSIKMVQKATFGFGSGLLLTYLFYLPEISLFIRLITVIVFASTLNLLMNVLHIKKHNSICDECEYTPGFDLCPGYSTDNY